MDFLKSLVESGVRIWTGKHSDNAAFRASFPPDLFMSGRPSVHGLPLTPSEAVKTYKIFTVVHRCFTKCKSVSKLIEENFKEEFKLVVYIALHALVHFLLFKYTLQLHRRMFTAEFPPLLLY